MQTFAFTHVGGPRSAFMHSHISQLGRTCASAVHSRAFAPAFADARWMHTDAQRMHCGRMPRGVNCETCCASLHSGVECRRCMLNAQQCTVNSCKMHMEMRVKMHADARKCMLNAPKLYGAKNPPKRRTKHTLRQLRTLPSTGPL